MRSMCVQYAKYGNPEILHKLSYILEDEAPVPLDDVARFKSGLKSTY